MPLAHDLLDFGIAVQSAVVTTIPVPPSFLLMGSGLIGLAGFPKKKPKQIKFSINYRSIYNFKMFIASEWTVGEWLLVCR